MLTSIIRIFRHSWKQVLLITVLVELCFLVTAWLMTPVYRAEVVLIPQNRSVVEAVMGNMTGPIGGLGSLLGFGGASSADDQHALAVLRSIAFTRDFILDNGLLPIFFADQWNQESGQWESGDVSKQPTILDGVRLFDESIRVVAVDSQSGIIRLRIEWTDAVQAAEWANKLAVRLNADIRRRTAVEAEKSITFLNRELANTKVVELRSALTRVLETELKRKMLADVHEEYAFRIVDPAVVPDADDFIRPKRLLIGLIGLVFGFGFAMLVIAVRNQP
jgi:uncharacterized protein involved in exopolysaccharide biosynthesis